MLIVIEHDMVSCIEDDLEIEITKAILIVV